MEYIVPKIVHEKHRFLRSSRMPLNLEIRKKFTTQSDRVKSIDIHPDMPWVLVTLYNGRCVVWDMKTEETVKSFDVTDLPLRAGKFIAREQWFVVGADDYYLHIFNYNTSEKIRSWLAHDDYIRGIDIHPSKPYIFSCSDDLTIRCWNWEKNFSMVRLFEGHRHFIMCLRMNPKDSNQFATASNDSTIKVWSINQESPNFTLNGHKSGVNCVDYYHGPDKPMLASGSDDHEIKIWDYQSKACLATLTDHNDYIHCVMFHPLLPVLLSGSEDGTVRVWNSTTYKCDTVLNFGMGRAWTIASSKSSNYCAIGYDNGTVVCKIGSSKPLMSMDEGGKVVWAENNDIKVASVKGVESESGEIVHVSGKDLGHVESMPKFLAHNNNGRFIGILSESEYTIYTAQTLRNKAYGPALSFVWASSGTGDYAVQTSRSSFTIYKSFKECKSFSVTFTPEAVFGGTLLAIKGPDFISFYDWNTTALIRRVDVSAKCIFWSDDNEFISIVCEDSLYVLKYNDAVAQDKLASARDDSYDAEGIEEAFELVHTVTESARCGCWVGACFIFVTKTGKLKYFVGGEIVVISQLDKKMNMLGYIAREGKIYLMDKSHTIVAYNLPKSVLDYQTAVIRGDFDQANSILPEIPEDRYNDLAHFLESQHFEEEAFVVSRDPEYKINLAIKLGKLDVALEQLEHSREALEPSVVEDKLKHLTALALKKGQIAIAEQCALAIKDVGSLLLIYTSTGDMEGMTRLSEIARDTKQFNYAILSDMLQGKIYDGIEVLKASNRLPEATLFARTYAPSAVPDLVAEWKVELGKTSEVAATSLASPADYPELFPDMDVAIQAEKLYNQQKSSGPLPASDYLRAKGDLDLNLIAMVKQYMEQMQLEAQKPRRAQQRAPEPASPTANQLPSPQQQVKPTAVTSASSHDTAHSPDKPAPEVSKDGESDDNDEDFDIDQYEGNDGQYEDVEINPDEIDDVLGTDE